MLGLFLGYLVLLLINPVGAGDAILTVIKNFWTYNRQASQVKYLGNTLVKTAPLLMCALSILFSYKVGLFNIGAAGQYCVGAALSLYAALGLGWSWLPCMLAAILGGALLAGISGLLKSYCNVNEVISGIMLNWIVLYLTNMLLTLVKEDASPYTKVLANTNASAVLPSLGLGALFNKNQYVGLAIPLAVVMAVIVWIVLDKTKFGYELKATGLNKKRGEILRHGGKAQHHPEPDDLRRSGRYGRGDAVPHQLRAVAVLLLLRPGHGLQRHRGCLPRRPEPHRLDLRLVLYPAYHRRRCVCR